MTITDRFLGSILAISSFVIGWNCGPLLDDHLRQMRFARDEAAYNRVAGELRR